MINIKKSDSEQNITIRFAVQEEIGDLKKMADLYTKELGFIIKPALIESIKKNLVLVILFRESIVGFSEYRHKKDEFTVIYHFVIHEDYRGMGLGKLLLDRTIKEAKKNNKKFIQLKCPEDLHANYFYQKNGFQIINTEKGKKRKINQYRKGIVL